MTDLLAEVLTDLTNGTKGSRDLSDRVLLALGWRAWNPQDEYIWTPSRQIIKTQDRPNPTVNLQDAVDLSIERQHDIELRIKPDGRTVVSLDGGPTNFSGWTPALAFCIYLLNHEAQT